MSIYTIAEPAYMNSFWCGDKIRGLNEELRRKRCKAVSLGRTEDLEKHLSNISKEFSSLIVIASSQSWTESVITGAAKYPVHPIIMCSQPYNSYNGGYSYVSLDLYNDMKTAVDYLKSRGKKHIAFFGIFTDSLHDACLTEAFSVFCTADKSHLFAFKTSLSECFESFFPRLEDFDAIICTNDIVTISLIQNLKDIEYPSSEKPCIVSLSASSLLGLCAPQIASLIVNFREFGKAAVSIHNTIKAHPSFSAISVLVKSELNTGAPARSNPYIPITGGGKKLAGGSDVCIYNEKHADRLIMLQNLLNQCDRIDYIIIESMMKRMTYSEINEKYYISVDSVKYRLRKMQSFCGFSSRAKLVDLFCGYFNTGSLEGIIRPKS